MLDKVKVSVVVMVGLLLGASWYLNVDPIIQKTFLSIFLAAIAWTPVSVGLKLIAGAMAETDKTPK